MDTQKCFEILQIDSWVSKHELKQVYRDLVDVWHPDRFAHNKRLRKKAEQKIKDINVAFKTIVDQYPKKHHLKKCPTDKRRDARNTFDIFVEFSIPGYQVSGLLDTIQDISASGVFIKTEKMIPIGQRVFLTFNLPGFGRLMNVNGKVARICDNGIGVQFIISAGYKKFIAPFIWPMESK